MPRQRQRVLSSLRNIRSRIIDNEVLVACQELARSAIDSIQTALVEEFGNGNAVERTNEDD
jgi:hypothetical protein